MRCLIIILLWSALAHAAAACAAAAAAPPGTHATLATTDTAIEVDAHEHAPRLGTLVLRPGGSTWTNRADETLPDHVEIGGIAQPLAWQLNRIASRVDEREIVLVYENASPHLTLTWRWQARATFGPVEHSIAISNLSGEAVWLPLLPSWRFDWLLAGQEPLERFWVEKGADAPSAEGTHLDSLQDGDSWEGTSSTYARPIAGQPREMIPYVLVENTGGAPRGWFVGIEFSGRTHITLKRNGTSLRGEAGLNPNPGPYRTRLMPGETFETPTVFVGTASGGPDGAGNQLRRWVRAVLNNPRTLRDPAYPLLVTNSWGSGMAIDESQARRMIVDAAQLGLEMFHLDAGWFRDVGDWHADPGKFPHGIPAIAAFAHRHGLRFGLWVSWAQAGTSRAPGALHVDDPAMRDWLIADPPPGWQHTESFKGITIDLGVPAARAWAANELNRIVRDDQLDMLEHDGYLVAQGSSRADHPAGPPDPATLRIYPDSGFLWVDSSNATDVSYHATRAYYAIQEQLRARHQGLLLEICNDGGRMVDFGSAAHGDYMSTTDIYDPLSDRRAFYDASYVLPPAMLESYVADWPAASIESFRYLLRSGMLGWFSLMLDTSRWNERQRAAAREEIALYKSKLRPLIREADLYHVAPRPDGVHWDGIEYFSAARGRGVLYAFRGSAPDEPAHRFQLSGLTPGSRYAVSFHDRGRASGYIATGRELMQHGVAVLQTPPLSSELVFFEEIRASVASSASESYNPAKLQPR